MKYFITFFIILTCIMIKPSFAKMSKADAMNIMNASDGSCNDRARKKSGDINDDMTFMISEKCSILSIKITNSSSLNRYKCKFYINDKTISVNFNENTYWKKNYDIPSSNSLSVESSCKKLMKILSTKDGKVIETWR